MIYKVYKLTVQFPEWIPGVGDGQGGLECCDSWGRKELDMTERLNWTEQKQLEQEPSRRDLWQDLKL